MAAGKNNVFYVKYLADEAVYQQIGGGEGSIALTQTSIILSRLIAIELPS